MCVLSIPSFLPVCHTAMFRNSSTHASTIHLHKLPSEILISVIPQGRVIITSIQTGSSLQQGQMSDRFFFNSFLIVFEIYCVDISGRGISDKDFGDGGGRWCRVLRRLFFFFSHLWNQPVLLGNYDQQKRTEFVICFPFFYSGSF